MISLRQRVKELELANRKLSDRWLLALEENVRLQQEMKVLQKRVRAFQKGGVK